MAIFKESKARVSLLVILTLLFFVLGVFPLLISNWKLISINREELESSLRESFVTTAVNVSTEIADYIRGYRLQVQEFNPKNFYAVVESGNQEATPLLMKDPNILKIRVLNREGKGPVAQKMNFQDPRIPNLEYEAFRQALQNKPYIGKPYYSRADDVPVILIAEPIHDQEGDTTGVVSVIVSLDPLLRILSEQCAGGTQIYVVHSSGNLL